MQIEIDPDEPITLSEKIALVALAFSPLLFIYAIEFFCNVNQ